MMLKQAIFAFAVLVVALTANAATFTVTTNSDSGTGSLRQAILNSNSTAGSDRIEFNIASGSTLITPSTVLPDITEAVSIDGTTQPGYVKAPLIAIDGSLIIGALRTTGGLHFLAANSQVIALSITSFRVPNYYDGAEGAGVIIGASGCSVQKCYLGLSRDGNSAAANDAGVRIDVGGALIDGNVISGNDNDGIANWGATAPSTIQNNIVGLNATATNEVPNTYGMYVTGDKVLNNRIAGNDYGDILMTGNGGVIKGNRIGVFGNGSVVSFKSVTAAVSIYGGFAGTSASVTVGGSAAGDGNEISASSYGIYVLSSSNAQIIGNTVHHNSVGIAIDGSVNSNISNNVIRDNFGAGIQIRSGSSNEIRNNPMYSNYVGIQLGTSPPLANDPGDEDAGANLGQNYPIVTRATSLNGSTTIQGTLNSTSSSTFRIDFYNSPVCSGRGYGEGKNTAGSTNVTTDSSGNATFQVTLPAGLPSGTVVTATATDSAGNTSEFSACASVQGSGAFGLTTTFQPGEGDTARFTVTRTSGSGGVVGVSWSTSDETAVAGEDYQASSGVLTFADGETQKTFTVSTINDTRYEGTEYFNVLLSNATGGATIGTPSSAHVPIFDNDNPPTLSVASISVIEGNSGTTNAVFTLKLSTPSTVPAVVGYYTFANTASSPSDYTQVTSTVTFAPGETEKQITVFVNGDTAWEADEWFSLQVSPISGVQGYQLPTCTIVNDDAQAELTFEDVSVVEGNAGTKVVNATLRATSPLNGYLYFTTFDGTARAGSDYQPIFNSVSFNNESQRTVSVTITGDTDVELDERFTLRVTENYTGSKLVKAASTVTIVNDDLGIGPRSQSIAQGHKGTVAISLGEPSLTDQIITIVSSNNTALSVPSSIIVPAGARTASFEINALTAPASAKIDVTLPAALGGTVLRVSVVSYEVLTLELQPSPLTAVAGTTTTITARLTPATAEPQLVTLEVSDPAIVDAPASITIPAGGSTTFAVKALRRGGASIRATLSPQYGSESTSLFVDVIDAPTTPVIFSVSPATGPVSGGSAVSISGARLRSDCSVAFGAAPAQTTFVSESQLTAITPPNGAGSVDVRLACGVDSFNLANGFTYLAAAPTLTGVAPSFGNVAGTTIVKLSGTNLSGACGVFLDGIAAHVVAAEGTTLLHAIAPPHAAASVDVAVKCGAASATRSASYNYTASEEPSAAIATIDPLFGSAGQPVTISGLRFRTADVVTFGNARAIVLSTTGEAHVVTIPDLPLGKVAITITDPNGHVSTTGPIFTIVEAGAPRITRATPSTVIAGNEIVVDGEGFRAGYSFSLGDRAATIVSMTYTRAIIRVPATDAGTYPLNVVNAAGNVAAIGPSIVIASHGVAVNGVSTSCGSTDGGETITIRGNGFVSGASVTIANVAATNVIVIDANTITATIPASSNAGAARIVVANSNGDSGSLTGAFRYVSPFDPDGCGGIRRRVGSRP